MSNKYDNQRPRQKTCSIKCVTNLQHNTPDKNLYCYNNVNIAIY